MKELLRVIIVLKLLVQLKVIKQQIPNNIVLLIYDYLLKKFDFNYINKYLKRMNNYFDNNDIENRKKFYDLVEKKKNEK